MLIFGAACLAAALALVVAVAVMVSGREPARIGPPVSDSGQPLFQAAFDLTDFDGRAVDADMLKGRWSLVFFGYTYCPDYCPTTLAMLSAVEDRLGGDMPAVVFISFDPVRDTPQALKDYLSSDGFPEGVTGLTGTPEQIRAAARTFGAYYEQKGEGETAIFDHSLYIYLIGPDGSARALLSESLAPDQAADLIRRTMRRG